MSTLVELAQATQDAATAYLASKATALASATQAKVDADNASKSKANLDLQISALVAAAQAEDPETDPVLTVVVPQP